MITGAIGATAHLAAELLKSMARVNIVHVPYKSNGIALNNLIAGEVQLSFSSAGSVAAHVKSGRLRALAVTTAQPSVLLPDLPTVAASGGLPGYECASVNGIFAPAGTPAPIVNRLYQEIARVLSTPDIKQRFLANGVEPVGSTPEEFAATIKSEMVRLSKVIKDANIRAD
jgi:tripartite-type tricarboxylate transporter receptor subunit TctC